METLNKASPSPLPPHPKSTCLKRAVGTREGGLLVENGNQRIYAAIVKVITTMCSLVRSIFLYVCESWAITAELQRIQAMEMRCYHKILRISYKDHVTNEENPCKDPAGNQTTQRPPDQRTETQTAVAWTCLPFIRSGQNHLARHSERGKKTR